MKIFNSRIPLLGAVILGAAVLGGCTSSSSDTTANNNQSTASAVKVTAMKGQFKQGSTVTIKKTSDSSVVATGTVGADGTASVSVPAGVTGPFLIEAGVAGDQYFDESTGAMATIPAGGTGLRALITSATASPSVGVTALTEMAVGQIEGASGIAAATTLNVMAANTTVGIQFGVANPLVPPSVIGSGTTVSGTSAADTYALKLAGLAKMANGVPALQAIKAMSADMADGTLNGQIGTTAVTGLNSYTNIATLTTELNTQVAAATTQYAPGATAPTVTISVADLAALLQAAYKVGLATQTGVTGLSADVLNAQIATTLQTQVQAISTAVAAGTTIATAEATAVTAATATATTLANATVAGQQFMDAVKAGKYSSWGKNSKGYLEVQKQSATADASGTLTFANARWEWNTVTGAWAATTAVNKGWQLGTTGWVADDTESVTIAANADGTIGYVSNTGQSGTFLPKVTALDATPTLVDPCVHPSTYNGMIVPTTCTATYPAGSVSYEFFGHVRNQDSYWLNTNWTAGSINTDANATELTALPAIGSGFCANGSYYRPIAGVAAGANNYDVIGAGTCNLTNITAAKSSTTPFGSVYLVSKATGNTTVPNVLHIARTTLSVTNTTYTQWATQAMNQIFGLNAGKVYQGNVTLAGPTPADWNNLQFNKIAMDANVAVFGTSVIPDTWINPAIANVTAMLADVVSGNMRDWWNIRYNTAAAPTTYTNDVRVGYSMPTVSGNTYTFTGSTNYMSLNNGAWTPFTAVGEYNLLAAGWSNTNGGVVVNNLDGTLTVTPTGQASVVETVTRTDLTGTAIPCQGYAPTACATATYPTGSYSSSSNYTSAVDHYSLRTVSGGVATTVTNVNGMQLTSLPATPITTCVSYGHGGQVFVPMASPTATDSDTVYGTWSCSASDIASAITGTAQGTVLLSAQATGNSVVPYVGLVTVSGASLTNLSWMQNRIVGVVNGLVYPGDRAPAGPRTDLSGKSKIAIDAELVANGLIATSF